MTIGQQPSASIRLENVAVIRGNRMVFGGFSLSADAGDIVWIRGANGSGKSTLLRLAGGLLTAASGTVDIRGSIALADENSALDVNRRLEDALAFWGSLDGTSGARCDAAMAAMDLVALAEVPVRYLSTGQKRRAGLARLMATGATIWLLDEPYNGLDSANAARLDAALLAHARSGGIALVAAHASPTINVAQSVKLDSASRAAA